MSKHEVRRQTFADIEKTVIDLPIVFEGTLAECGDYCNNQPGFVRKNAPKHLFGAYWYDRENIVALLVT